MEKILKKYNNIDIKLKASFWFMICNILQKGVALLTTPIFTRIMSNEQYGQYANYQSWSAIIIIFATLNLYGGVYNNGLLKYEDRMKFTSAVQGLSTTSCIVCFSVYIFFSSTWNSLFHFSTPLMILMFIEFLFSPAYSYWLMRNRFGFKYKRITLLTIISTIINPLLAVLTIVNTEHKVEARVLSHTVVIVLFSFLFYINHFNKGKCFFDKEIWKYALCFNLPLIPHYLSQIILQQSDRIMITNLVGSTQTAFYSVAYSISMLMFIITNSINSTLVPHTYQTIKNGNLKELRDSSNKLVFLVSVGCLSAVLIAPEIIKIFATEEYYDAIWVMPPVCISVFFMFVFGLFSNVEFYYEKTKGIMIASIIAAMLNVLLNYLFIPIWGYYAAGYTTLASYIVFSLMHYYMYRKIIKGKNAGVFIYDTSTILFISIATLIGMFVLSLTYRNTLIRYALIIFIVIIGIANYKKIVSLIKRK